MKYFLLIFLQTSIAFTKPFEVYEIGDKKYVEIEAVHLIDTHLGIQIVHAIVALSSVPLNSAIHSKSVWYIPEQEEWPKLAYLTSHGWFFISENDNFKIQKNRRGIAKKAHQDAQLDVTSLVRLAPSSFTDVQFIKKGSIGAYVYSSDGVSEPERTVKQPSHSASNTQMIQSGNLAALIYSESSSSSDISEESLFWLIPAIGISPSSKSYTTRIHDGSFLLYTGVPKLIKMKI